MKATFTLISTLLTLNSYAFFGKGKCPIEKCGTEYSKANLDPKGLAEYFKNYETNKHELDEILQRVTISNPQHTTLRKSGKFFFHQDYKDLPCKPKQVETLIKAKVKVMPYHLSGALRARCVDSVKLLLPKLSNAQIRAISTSYYAKSDFSDSDQKKMSYALLPIVNKVKSECKKNKDQDSCKSLKNFKLALKNFEKRYKNHIYLKSPEGKEQTDANYICNQRNKALKYKGFIKEERAKGKISGFVNIVKIKKWGDSVYEYDKNYKQALSSYKIKHKEDFDKNRCK